MGVILVINMTYTDECLDMSWICQQLKKIADPLNHRYDTLHDIGRRLRLIGDGLNDRNNNVVSILLSVVELYLWLL